MKITLFLEGKENTYVTPKFVSGLIYRKAIKLQADGRFPSAKEEDMNEIINLICEMYENKFTIDEYWKGCHVQDLHKNIDKFIAYINGHDVDAAEEEKAPGKKGK